MTAERVEEQTTDESAAPTADTAGQAADATPADGTGPKATTGEARPEATPDNGNAPLATADPSPEAAIGASGARPLGDASEVAARADDAVAEMIAQPAAESAEAVAGAPDVDTSVEVIGTAPMFLACPLYFNRSIGDAGQVAGGTVQAGSHN